MKMLKEYLEKVLTRNDLEASEMADAMDAIMDGKVPEAQLAAFLAALRVKGETVDEIAEAARVMRDKAVPVEIVNRPVMDIVGTGGDRTGTFNISTASAMVVAAAGVRIAKHGNGSVSSLCGSADILAAMGVPLFNDPVDVAECIESTGFGFIFAPYFHKAMKNVVPVRKAIGLRTIFNILGPLTNPARPEYQAIGVFMPSLVHPMAEVIGRLGVKKAIIFYGHGGMDELSISGPNNVSLLNDGEIEDFELHPSDAGLPRAEDGYAKGGSTEVNLRILDDIFAGAKGPKRDVVVFNSAASLMVAGKVSSLNEGARLAEEVIDNGRAAAKVKEVAAFGASRIEGTA